MTPDAVVEIDMRMRCYLVPVEFYPAAVDTGVLVFAVGIAVETVRDDAVIAVAVVASLEDEFDFDPYFASDFVLNC